MMSLRRAPTALRMPISRVRSVTLTSMMFITPMPPTSRPIELSTTITSATVAVTLWNCSIICSDGGQVKTVGGVVLVAAAQTQHRADFVLGLVHHARVRLRHQHVFRARWETSCAW